MEMKKNDSVIRPESRDTELPPGFKDRVLGFLGPYEQIQLARTNIRANKYYSSILEPLKVNRCLSIYKVYSGFKKSTGSQRESFKRLLLTSSALQPLKDCLLDDGPFEVSRPFSFSSMFKYIGSIITGYPNCPLCTWLWDSGKTLSTDMIKIVIENVSFANIEFSVLFKIIDKYELGYSKSKQRLVSLLRRYPQQAELFGKAVESALKYQTKETDYRATDYGLELSPPTIMVLLDVVEDLKRPFGLGDWKFFRYCITQGHYDFASKMVNLCENCIGLEAMGLYEKSNKILLHSQQVWCTTEERLKFALVSIFEPNEIMAFFSKLKTKIRVSNLSESFSGTLKSWIAKSYPERLFDFFLSRTTGFVPSLNLCERLVKTPSNINFAKWRPTLVLSLLIKSKGKFNFSKEQFFAIATYAQQHIYIGLATFAEKRLWLLRHMIQAHIHPLILKYFVLQYRKAFLNSHTMHDKAQNDMIEIGLAHGYEFATMDFIVQRVYPKQPLNTWIWQSTIEANQWYRIASTNYGSIQTAELVLSHDAFQDLLLYEPARWCKTEEAVHFVVSKVSCSGRLLHFLDCLPRQRKIKISQKTFKLAYQSHSMPEQFFLKLLEKFPSSDISWYNDKQYLEWHDRFDAEGS